MAELIDGSEPVITMALAALRGLGAGRRFAPEAAFERLRQFLLTRPQKQLDEVHRASSALEAINRLDSSLLPVDLDRRAGGAEDIAKRMSAAMLLWDRAEVAPEEVPLRVARASGASVHRGLVRTGASDGRNEAAPSVSTRGASCL